MLRVLSGGRSEEEEVETIFTVAVQRLPGSKGTIAVRPPVKFAYPSGSTVTHIVSTKGPTTGDGRATGDPHLQNILGQRFDIMNPGRYSLLQIPRGASDSDTLLHVQADVNHEGDACSDMYFKTLNITGEWACAAGGYTFVAD